MFLENKLVRMCTLGWVKFSEWKKTGCGTVVAKYAEDPKQTIF